MGNVSKVSIGSSLIAISMMACVLVATAAGCGGGDSGSSSGGMASGVPAGIWGSNTAEVNTNSTSAVLIQNCSRDDLPPIAPDASGNFAFTAKYNAPPIILQNADYQGHVSGQTMQITVTDPNSRNVVGSFNLTFGGVMPPYTGVCPG